MKSIYNRSLSLDLRLIIQAHYDRMIKVWLNYWLVQQDVDFIVFTLCKLRILLLSWNFNLYRIHFQIIILLLTELLGSFCFLLYLDVESANFLADKKLLRNVLADYSPLLSLPNLDFTLVTLKKDE
jgi:hypothetical protein